MRILGISAFYHDSACAMVVDGEIVAAAQEERFTRKKQDSRFPSNALEYCLEAAGTRLRDVDHVVFYEKPFLKFERLLETYLSFAPAGFQSFQAAIPLWLREKLFQKDLLQRYLREADPEWAEDEKLLFTEHHHSHAASAFFPSPFEDAVVLTVDGVGEWATTSVSIGRGNQLEMLKEMKFPHSLGLLYSAFTYYLGFKVNSGEYKVMGLAPYGQPRYRDRILENLVDLKEDGTFRLSQSFFNYCTGLTMTSPRFNELFGGPPRKPGEPLSEHHMDLAASVQAVTEEAMLRLTAGLARETGQKNLCLAGGVALNCVANGRILREAGFENIWVQPAAGDAGGALGAALVAYYGLSDKPRQVHRCDSMRGSYLGPAFQQEDIEARLRQAGAVFDVVQTDEELIDATVEFLTSGGAVGWFQGRMEYGPRALGSRSIIADARSPSMQRTLNLKVKFRESFRPFAPSVLAEDVADWFMLDRASPYMLLVADVLESRRRSDGAQDGVDPVGLEKINAVRSEIPAVTHVDYSARIQTVHAETNERYHRLLSGFKERTGCPVLVNTSFNVRGEPIVCTPEDAYNCFMGTGLDYLVIGNCLLRKEDQPEHLSLDYRNAFELD